MLCHGGWLGCSGGVGDGRVFGDGGKVVVWMVMMTNFRLAVVITKNSFIYMLHGFVSPEFHYCLFVQLFSKHIFSWA